MLTMNSVPNNSYAMFLFRVLIVITSVETERFTLPTYPGTRQFHSDSWIAKRFQPSHSSYGFWLCILVWRISVYALNGKCKFRWCVRAVFSQFSRREIFTVYHNLVMICGSDYDIASSAAWMFYPTLSVWI